MKSGARPMILYKTGADGQESDEGRVIEPPWKGRQTADGVAAAIGVRSPAGITEN